MIRPAAIVFSLSLASTLAAGDLQLALPLDCQLGENCFIQNYMDHDPSPEHVDFTCGPQTYDGHKGTDFALPSLAAMHKGVAVHAAAPGVVKALRDTMADIAMNAADAPELDGKDCGNGLVIDHGNGWETQYCHMKRGSFLITQGQAVGTGTALGQVGLSGRTEFPHLHLSLRQNGIPVDPFAPDSTGDCSVRSEENLWQDPISYQPGGLIAIGFADHLPTFAELKADTASPHALRTTAPALVIWAYVYDGRSEDSLSLNIAGPNGALFHHVLTLEKHQAQLFRAGGKRSPGVWPAGQYVGTVSLQRQGVTIDQAQIAVEITTP